MKRYCFAPILAALGCNTGITSQPISEGGPGGESAEGKVSPGDEQLGSLCSSCVAGGETTDFSGERLDCTTIGIVPEDAQDLDSETARAFHLRERLTAIERSFTAPATWTKRWGYTQTAGYEQDTEVEIEVQVMGSPTYVPSCDNLVAKYLVPVQITIHAQDDSIEGTFVRGYSFLESGYSSLGFTGIEEDTEALDLADFYGVLDLAVDGGIAHSGVVMGALDVVGAWGRIRPAVIYEHTRTWSPLELIWPKPEGCALILRPGKAQTKTSNSPTGRNSGQQPNEP